MRQRNAVAAKGEFKTGKGCWYGWQWVRKSGEDEIREIYVGIGAICKLGSQADLTMEKWSVLAWIPFDESSELEGELTSETGTWFASKR